MRKIAHDFPCELVPPPSGLARIAGHAGAVCGRRGAVVVRRRTNGGGAGGSVAGAGAMRSGAAASRLAEAVWAGAVLRHGARRAPRPLYPGPLRLRRAAVAVPLVHL